MLPHIETERLLLRPLNYNDIDLVERHWANPLVRKYLWDDEAPSREKVIANIERSASWFQEKGFGLWKLLLRENEEFVGVAGYTYFNGPEEEIMYGLEPAYWGKGYATEAARALVHFGFAEAGLEHIAASADPPHLATMRVLEKAGLSFEREVVIDGQELLYYGVNRSSYDPGPGHFRVERR